MTWPSTFAGHAVRSPMAVSFASRIGIARLVSLFHELERLIPFEVSTQINCPESQPVHVL